MPSLPTLPAAAHTTLPSPASSASPIAGTAAPIKVLPGQIVHLPQPSATPIAQMQQPIYQSPLAAKYPWVTHTFAGLFLFSALALVFLLAIQTTKQEGLSGTLGGRVESAYRPRLGFDQQLQRLTTIVAISFVILGLIVSFSGI